VELFHPRNIAIADHIVEIHPSVSFGDQLHPWDKGDTREVNAPLLNNSLLQDDLMMPFFSGVEETVCRR
ncbi:hypothetical protein A2U01_0098224, partial [Trifolium medium]|nr:hypothetical protein [Trifolium medium]